MSKHVCGVQERRRRVIKRELKSAKQSTNARQKESTRHVRNSREVVQIAVEGKRKTLTAGEPAVQRSCGARGGARRSTVHEPPSAPPLTVNSHGGRIR